MKLLLEEKRLKRDEVLDSYQRIQILRLEEDLTEGHIAKFCRKETIKEENKQAKDSAIGKVWIMSNERIDSIINKWTFDSGATDHMTPFKEILSRLYGCKVKKADGNSLEIRGKGSAVLNMKEEWGDWNV